ncbi:hypothetical protein M422DRAFT_276455 [Sphaerobolus stellatus SS14]|uniref:Uncharacterized protein n=1 Tax=Sphaerobolus stellatus (strain SS14) TaxID=990650 RepID=A0A0C9UC72_SPHS4|nr:hypothetical protein M422DRAFT_276455 [Sphaerobolus stellatus SS14]
MTLVHLAIAFQLWASTSQKDRGNQPVQWKVQLGPTAYAIDGRLPSPFAARSVNLTDFAHNLGETSQLTRRAFAALQTSSYVFAGGMRARRRPIARTPTTTTTSATARLKVHRSAVDDTNIQGTRYHAPAMAKVGI